MSHFSDYVRELSLIIISSTFLLAVSVPANAAFDWTSAKGESINVQLNKHPYADAIILQIPQFEKLTGISVTYSVTTEDTYFENLTAGLNSSHSPDVFMTGSYQLWDYASKGHVQYLDALINEPDRTESQFDIEDFFEGVLNGDRWDLTPGHPVGTGKLWAIPLGFEANVLIYNKRALEKKGLTVPQTFDELLETSKELNGWNGIDSYGTAVRGSLSWATIHPGYMSAFSNAGAKDFTIRNGRLVSLLDSPESIKVTQTYAQLIKESGPKQWSFYTWYNVMNDIGNGRAAMALDADILGFFMNKDPDSREGRNLAFAPMPVFDNGVQGANEWIWSLAMSNSSAHKQAAWLFMQYMTGKKQMLWGATHNYLVNPVRKSIWDSKEWQQVIKGITGYEETFMKIIDNVGIKFTPQPMFFETTTDWAGALQDIVLNNAPVAKRMKELANSVDRKVSTIPIQ